MPDGDYDWRKAGEEWSEPWGNATAEWAGVILPRVSCCLPAGRILEIAPGFGRWTEFLRHHCEHIAVVDSNEQCIETCRQRFADDPRVRCFVNNGQSLDMIDDDSIDFVFTFDSLVHTTRSTIEAYLRQLAAKLKPNGRAFIHHSNFAEYVANSRLPTPLRKLLTNAGVLARRNQRATDMSAEIFRSICAREGLHCLTQEIINWRGRWLIDCFSLIKRDASEQAQPTRIYRNRNFMREAELVRLRAHLL